MKYYVLKDPSRNEGPQQLIATTSVVEVYIVINIRWFTNVSSLCLWTRSRALWFDISSLLSLLVITVQIELRLKSHLKLLNLYAIIVSLWSKCFINSGIYQNVLDICSSRFLCSKCWWVMTDLLPAYVDVRANLDKICFASLASSLATLAVMCMCQHACDHFYMDECSRVAKILETVTNIE